MNNDNEIKIITINIKNRLEKLEGYFWDVTVEPRFYDGPSGPHPDAETDDKDTWLFYGTRELYYWICLFLELKSHLHYLEMFRTKFSSYIDSKSRVREVRNPLYEDSEPSMVILDDFREFLSAYPEFSGFDKVHSDKLFGVLSETNGILQKTHIKPTNETSIYATVRWFLEVIYPKTKLLNKVHFFDKFTSYQPDILIPEIASAVEYKYIRSGKNTGNFLNQLKTDADNYKGDLNYSFFYAVVYFENKSELNQAAFKAGVSEKLFPDNWKIIAL